MRRLGFAMLAIALLATACGDDAGGTAATDTPATTAPPATSPPPTSEPPPSTEPPPAPGDPTPTVMALALRQLVTVDTTFGPGHRFDTLLVQSSTASQPGPSASPETLRPLTDAERAAIEEAISDVSDIQWIDDPDEWRTDDLLPVVENSAIIGVGEPRFDDDGALVPVSLWCGGLCGTWFAYRVRQQAGEWAVVGPEGPVTIS